MAVAPGGTYVRCGENMLVTSVAAVALPVVMSTSALTVKGPPAALARNTRYPVTLATAFHRRAISPEPPPGPAVTTSTAPGTAALVVVAVDGAAVVGEDDGAAVVVEVDAVVVVAALFSPSSPPHAAPVRPIKRRTAGVTIRHRSVFIGLGDP